MPKDNSKPTRERRTRQAQERQAERDKRSPEEQKSALFARPGFAKRERARLTLDAA